MIVRILEFLGSLLYSDPRELRRFDFLIELRNDCLDQLLQAFELNTRFLLQGGHSRTLNRCRSVKSSLPYRITINLSEQPTDLHFKAGVAE